MVFGVTGATSGYGLSDTCESLNGLPVDVYVAERGGWQQLTLVDCRILVLRSSLSS